MTTSPGPNEPKVRGGLVGVGLAACAVCCAAPLMALLGIGVTGAALTAVTIAFAGIAFGLVVAVATLLAVLARRRRAEREHCEPAVVGPVSVELGPRPEEP